MITFVEELIELLQNEENQGQRHSSVAGLTKDTPQSVAFPRKCINFAA